MTMTKRLPRPMQRGFILLEGLIAILLFSFGILALVGMQAAAIRGGSDAKYRADASFLADKLVAQMWLDDQTLLATNYDTGGNFVSTSSKPKLSAWLQDLSSAQTGLPRAVAQVGVVAATNTVTVAIQWQAPQDTRPHSYVAVAQIRR
jgi:type IV pilus assembly protein PilV